MAATFLKIGAGPVLLCGSYRFLNMAPTEIFQIRVKKITFFDRPDLFYPIYIFYYYSMELIFKFFIFASLEDFFHLIN
jgi:hypothetical protein